MTKGARVADEWIEASTGAVPPAEGRDLARRIDAALAEGKERFATALAAHREARALLAEREAQIAGLVAELDQIRVYRFNETTGCLSWNRRSAAEHPDQCRCQDEVTPHKHYADLGNACARCNCKGYVPAIPTSAADATARFVERARREAIDALVAHAKEPCSYYIGVNAAGSPVECDRCYQIQRLVEALPPTKHDEQAQARARQEGAEEMRGRWIKALCSTCCPDHVLDNGRVWGFCGTQRIIVEGSPGIPETEVAAAIRALGQQRGK